MSNLDNIIYDIFGVKHFVKKLNESYDSRDIADVIETVGSKHLMDIMNNSKLYDALVDLVAINYRIGELRKELRKQSKKDKRDKSDVKEYKYLSNLYEESIKYFRKKLGIKNSKTSYKRRYRSLNNVVNHDGYDYDDDDFTSILLRTDDFYFDDDYESDYDDDDDYESTSELEDFVRRMNGRQSERQSRRNPNRPNNERRYRQDPSDFDLDEEDDDDEDDDWLESSRKPSRNAVLPSMEDKAVVQLNRLTDTVAELSGAVHALMVKDEYTSAQRRKERYEQNIDPNLLRPAAQPGSVITTPYNSQIDEMMNTLNSNIKYLVNDNMSIKQNQKEMAKAMDQVVMRENELMGVLGELIDLSSDDDDEPVMVEYPFNNSRQITDVINMHEDVYENMDETPVVPRDLKKMTKEELIDAINNSSDDSKFSDETVEVEQTVTEVTETTEVVEKTEE